MIARFGLTGLALSLTIVSLKAQPLNPAIPDYLTREQPDGAQTTPADWGPPPYLIFRDMENYEYLRDPKRYDDFFDPIKYIPFSTSGDDYASFGGEIRQRYESWTGENFGLMNPKENNYWLQRYMLHLDLHLGSNIRLFTQMKSDLEEYREPGPEPVQRDELNLHQAYLDLSQDLDDDGDRFTLRTGRQELAYGIGRILDPREGPNARETFDGFKAITTIDKWEIDDFATRPVETNTDSFDNPEPSTRLWGVYATHPNWWLENSSFDFYYLGTSRKQAPFFAGTQNEVRHTLGLRLDGHEDNFDYDTEGAYQFGTFGSGDISAWFYSIEAGYRFAEDFGQPHLALKFDIHSGNNSSSGPNLSTFENLYARGNYYSEPSPIGPQNSIALHPQLDWFPTKGLQLTFSPIFYWRESANDGVYNFPGYPDIPGSPSQGLFVGTETFLQASWQANRHLCITAVYDHFFRGDFLNDVPGTSDSDYVAVWATVKF